MKNHPKGPKVNAPLPKGAKIDCNKGRQGTENAHHNGSNS